MKSLKRSTYFKFGALGLILVLFTVMYVLLLSALPKYAARVPLMLLLGVLDWFLYLDIRRYLKLKFNNTGVVFAIFWWLPMLLLLAFLILSTIYPIQEIPALPRTYLPGISILGYLVKMVLVLFFVPAYLLTGATILFKRITGKPANWAGIISNVLKKMGIFFGSLAFAGLIIGSTVWVYKFKIHRINLSIASMPVALDNLRIVHLSDIHLGSWMSTKPLQRAVDSVNALKPDIIVFTGDLVNYSTAEVKGFESTLAGLKARLGIYSITGNHDYGDYTTWPSPEAKQKNFDDLVALYKQLGWKLLLNQVDYINVDSARIMIAGVENWSSTARFKRYGDLAKTMKNHDFADVNILLSHDPTHWEAEVFKKYPEFDLTLAGHTHGMQMGIEAFGLRWSPAQYVYKHWAGLARYHQEDGSISNLYVNRGLGHIAYPGRVGILPEITLIKLSAK